MRNTIGLITAFCLCAASVSAQTTNSSDSHRVAKILIGVGALAAGATVAAKSSQTTTTTSALGTSETTSFSTSQLVTGLVIAGTGGILLWDGLRDHRPASPSTAIRIAIDKRSGALLSIRRTW
jgi:zinc transporter ZupT